MQFEKKQALFQKKKLRYWNNHEKKNFSTLWRDIKGKVNKLRDRAGSSNRTKKEQI